MTKQDINDKLNILQQRRLSLSVQLDQMALQLQLWDERISLLRQMLVTLQTQSEQEEKLIQLGA